jgi:hypothetical protein
LTNRTKDAIINIESETKTNAKEKEKNTMKEMINEYKEMLNRLHALGLDILGQAEEEDLDEETYYMVDEIENMDMHLECAKNILN